MEAFGAAPLIVLFGKLVLAAVLGLLVGTERAVLAKQAAGSRTFALVALAACAFVVAGLQVDAQYVGIMSFDPMRTLAAIIQGAGFLGAGLIIFRGDSLHGITTAASIWVAAAVGSLVGFGMYAVALFSTTLLLLILFGLWYVENRFKHWVADLAARFENSSDNQHPGNSY